MRSRRTVALLAALACLAGTAVAIATPTGGSDPAVAGIGLRRLLAGAGTDEATPRRAIATFDAVPSTDDVVALRDLGLRVQPMRHLPLAIVDGPVGAIADAVARGAAVDVYPEEQLELLDMESSDAMAAAATRAAGLTGKGVTVAVVDSGCDATHPDLADHVTHNVKLVSAEYANVRPDSSNTIVVPLDGGPYSNTDLGSGHGTHVAGIIAADGTADPTHLGVAPDAELVCYSIGEVLATTAVVTAYDHLLDQPGLWGVDVINNSWGNTFEMFDPRNPVAVATKAVADLGVTVVFAAGNNGSDNAEMSLSPFSLAPWVISVGAGTVDHRRGDFSSNGLRYDNSVPVTIGAGGHAVFTGDRIGLYHPDVTAPGVEISSTCDPIGVLVAPCPPASNAEASGTSMASPHVAGAAAVLKQVNPALTPDQVRRALEVTAAKVDGTEPDDEGNSQTAPDFGFWQTGYGYVDLAAAVELVRSPNFADRLAALSAEVDHRLLTADGVTVARSDFWTWDAPRVSIGGVPDTRTFTVDVPTAVTHLKVTLHHPGFGVVGGNFMQYTATIRDATGKVVGVTEENPSDGVAGALVDLQGVRGRFTIEVTGDAAVSDPDTIDSDSLLGEMLTLHVAQLTAVP